MIVSILLLISLSGSSQGPSGPISFTCSTYNNAQYIICSKEIFAE